MEELDKFKKIVAMSLNLTAMALDELLVLNEIKTDPEVAKLIEKGPFKFYRIPLQYMITIEIKKLLEKDSKYRKNFRKGESWEDYENTNAASLSKFLRKTFEIKGVDFKKTFQRNRAIIEDIWASEFYKSLVSSRDKKFGHSDSDYHIDPMEIRTFSENEIREAKSVLGNLVEIFSDCTESNFFTFKFPQTRNFIEWHIVYEDFYSKNEYEAMKQGFTPMSRNRFKSEK